MSDTTPDIGKTNTETGASPTPAEQRRSEAAGYAAAAAAQPNGNTGSGSHSAPTERLPEPTPVEPVTSETYVPSATVGGESTGAGTLTNDSATREQPTVALAPVQPLAPAPIYVQAPPPPRYRNNRGAGVLIALLATAVYAVIYTVVAFVIAGVGSRTLVDAAEKLGEFVVRPVFYVPVIFFFLALTLLVLIVNRGGWWAYVLVGFVVGAVVYFSYLGGALITVQAWSFTPAVVARFIGTQWLNPGAIAAAVIAREVTILAGAWIAALGRNLTARNIEARQDYERQLAEGPQIARPA